MRGGGGGGGGDIWRLFDGRGGGGGFLVGWELRERVLLILFLFIIQVWEKVAHFSLE